MADGLFQGQKMTNCTRVPGFILQGFSGIPELQSFSAAIFLFIYIFSVLGNISIITAVNLDSHLHTPMYFFLKHLSFIDMCSTTTTLPRALFAALAGSEFISLPACAVQLFGFVFCGATECFLITSMAYDRCLAIYQPLTYGTTMTPEFCCVLVVVAWVSGLLFSSFHTVNTFTLSFHDSIIEHFFCDIPPLLRLSCTDPHKHEAAGFIVSGCVIMSCFALTVLSYIRILVTVARIKSTQGRQKAFSTCSSHLITVLLFYGTGSSAYMRPANGYSPLQGRLAAIFYSILTPTLNPIIYSMRNRDMKAALRKLYGHRT
ncbi:olfactory receptor 5B12-like [Sarcophilus harrisii]|uniref:olfactory receptor 5B12-like n=1 Tax=Sarcophilus harrisii TaxID=9305 RepID=UPI001301B681|nr:olfactory receptor 5B12-like [Sarcophilus harrisii]